MGAVGVLVRRNPLVILVCIELMLNAANLTLIAFSRQLGNLDGQLFALMTMTVAAAGRWSAWPSSSTSSGSATWMTSTS